MASIRYVRRRRTWEVRSQATNRVTGETVKLDRMLAKGATHEDAKSVAAEFDRQARCIRSNRVQPAESLTRAKAIWLDLCRSKSARTHELYSLHIDRFLASLPPEVQSLQQLVPLHLSSFLAAIVKTTSAATANRHLTTLKSFCKWFSTAYQVANPASAVSYFKEPDPDTRFLTADEFARIMAACKPTTRDVLLFIANTGARAGELVRLRFRDIAADGRSILIYGKGGKKRGVPLNSLCREILARIAAMHPAKGSPDSCIFMSKSNPTRFRYKPITRRGLSATCRSIASRAGMSPFGPHALRHWFATQLLLGGVPITQVSMLMGHASVTTTQRHYAHILPEHLIGLTECLVDRRRRPRRLGT